MDAYKRDEPNAAQHQLQERRSLANARHERDNERRSLLGRLMEAERQASQLRAWISRNESHFMTNQQSELSRMLQWAAHELELLETVAEPARLAALVHNQNLFPEVDQLADPLGEPPPLRPWGR